MLHSQGIGRIFGRLKYLTGLFVHFYIFTSIFSHGNLNGKASNFFVQLRWFRGNKTPKLGNFQPGKIRPLPRVKVALRATNSSLLAELGVPAAATFRYKMTIYFISLVQSATGHWHWRKDPA